MGIIDSGSYARKLAATQALMQLGISPEKQYTRPYNAPGQASE
jgi:hypothetical protein